MQSLESPTMKIGNDVWIGARAVILSAVTIGDGAIVGANAVVTKDIPPYAIAVGVPAKVIRYRCSEEQAQKLQQIAWWDCLLIEWGKLGRPIIKKKYTRKTVAEDLERYRASSRQEVFSKE
jgi:tetrahydrodipicolinate N-succinyltransferase